MKEMTWIVLSSCLLFTMFIVHSVAQGFMGHLIDYVKEKPPSERPCEPRVVDSNCNKQCHCRSGNCTMCGECTPRGDCEDGWGGIHCNYRDAAFFKYLPLTDNSLSTCLISDPTLNYRHEMREETKLTWIRFNLQKQNVFDSAKIVFEDSSGMTVIPKFLRKIVDGYTVDLIGSMDKKFKSISISFKSRYDKPHFCGMFVSGGRNVAFKQPVSLSSVWKCDVAERAVDGVRDANFDKGHCASTQAGKHAWLSLRPRQPIDVNYIGIYNRNYLQCRLKYFKMWLLSDYYWNTTVQIHHDKQREPHMFYKVFATTFEPIRWIYLGVQESYWENEGRHTCGDSPHENVLTVCELEVYGEVICPVGRYGYDCEKRCVSDCVSGCHVETGYCFECAAWRSGRYCEIIPPPGRACEPRVFGLNCNSQCHCRIGDCTVLGKCSDHGCKDRWGGIHCNYRDTAFDKASPLTDNSLETCLDNSTRTVYRFDMIEETKLTWIRFNLKKQNVFDNATISFEDSSNETVIPTFLRKIVDGYTVDFIGSMKRKFLYIKLVFKSFENKQDFCGMFVSGGRNVAFKQPASLNHLWKDFFASRAVDGVRDARLWNRHCVLTVKGETEWLRLTPRHPIDVNYIEIYHGDHKPCKLRFYKLFLMTGDDLFTPVQFHYDKRRMHYVIYKVLATTFEPIRRIYLGADRNYRWIDDPTSRCGNPYHPTRHFVCELEVYGEVICREGRYGYECEKSCDSDCVSGCHVETGYCFECAAGRSGKHCEISETTEFFENSLANASSQEFFENSPANASGQEFFENSLANASGQEFFENSLANASSQEFFENSLANASSQEFIETSPGNDTSQEFFETSPGNATSQEFFENSLANASSQEFFETFPTNASSQESPKPFSTNATSQEISEPSPANATSQGPCGRPAVLGQRYTITSTANVPPGESVVWQLGSTMVLYDSSLQDSNQYPDMYTGSRTQLTLLEISKNDESKIFNHIVNDNIVYSCTLQLCEGKNVTLEIGAVKMILDTDPSCSHQYEDFHLDYTPDMTSAKFCVYNLRPNSLIEIQESGYPRVQTTDSCVTLDITDQSPSRELTMTFKESGGCERTGVYTLYLRPALPDELL